MARTEEPVIMMVFYKSSIFILAFEIQALESNRVPTAYLQKASICLTLFVEL